MNKLRIDEPSTLDDLEDINSLIDTEVGVENLNQNEFENNQLMAQFQQDMAKIKVCEFLMQVFFQIFFFQMSSFWKYLVQVN